MRAQAASLSIAPGRWLGPQTAAPPAGAEQQQQEQQGPPVYGVELTADQWDPLNLHQTVLKVWCCAGRAAGGATSHHAHLASAAAQPHVLACDLWCT